jgi:acetyl-CoA synthetase
MEERSEAMSEPSKGFDTVAQEQAKVPPSESFRKRARISSLAEYERLYKESLEQPDTFWRREAQDLSFRKPWTETLRWEAPFAKWFLGAELNVSESCLDRHLASSGDKRAIIWEAEDGATRELTYRELHAQVVGFAAGLRGLGVTKGDRVVLYMGMVPEAVVAMLACARIGAPHSVVFGGFAADSLKDRINDCQAKVVITQDAAPRRGALVPLKETVNAALQNTPSVQKVVVLDRLGTAKAHHVEGRDVDWAAVAAGNPEAGAPEIVDAEHPLFILYTSGSTGKPKGVLHTSAGYLVGAHLTTKYVFDIQPDDVYFCTADIGWITGHSYLVYGPLSNAATCVIYEGAPNHPDWSRFWQLIDKHKVTILYTAPTAIRAFMRAGDNWVAPYDLSSLRLLGSVGEPINPEAWQWYYDKIGRRRCPIVDTWWQTETGSIMLTTLPGVHDGKPGSTGIPFFGVVPEIVTGDGTAVQGREGGLLVITRPWPSMLRTIWGDDDRFKKQYWSDIPGKYFTGDGAHRDDDGYFQVIGRVDDVLNVSGHRIGTAEIESSLVSHTAVAEAAAVGRPDDLTGQALVVFVSTKPHAVHSDELAKELREHVGREIGKFARPSEIRFAEALPKTRSGKIMRRLLKDIAAGREVAGDTSTLEDPTVLAKLRTAPAR